MAASKATATTRVNARRTAKSLQQRRSSTRPSSTKPDVVKASKSSSSITHYPFPVDQEAVARSLRRISSHPSLTPYRRLVYRTLLSVPAGRWTTYSTLSAHLSSSARAIGNAMKTNPFAPEVPCHRVLATDRTIGGYKGKWGNGDLTIPAPKHLEVVKSSAFLAVKTLGGGLGAACQAASEEIQHGMLHDS
ncbi:predicted protein [Uncinocarpus reesii 1704]|uniref:Methylated-DNA--protein-cysteine methyltransferase n=1 Tax=Uncinocarpus reesii (strain UAMH 1704) TaxID=336963 RepID=C4JWY1_UNCRE|nr:uncharacterized protein UREG_06154 [Uncinocarpus reesii 1704]EEP81289.1 predicted protein [Uncinocarpus reesii 1704]